MLQSLHARNLLSFGDQSAPVRFGPLNILIGPNGSGKSNLLSVLRLLRAIARSPDRRRENALRLELRRGGGLHEWLWKGAPGERGGAMIEAAGCRYSVQVIPEAPGFMGFNSWTETLEHIAGTENDNQQELTLVGNDAASTTFRDWLLDITIYDDLSVGRFAPLRQPQPADLPNHALQEDGLNLGMVLNRIRKNPAAKAALLAALGDLYEGVVDYDVSVEGGTVQVFLQEERFVTPASRLSDGTLRWLCLLAILLNPATQGLVCLEEPELGLHPDLLPRLADLLRAASERCQLIVTTHSDVLVDALNEVPEAILVCERHQGQTQVQRLEQAKLAVWLEKYTLGQLWRSGQIGGNRW